MDLLWPGFLILLGILPLGVAAYVWTQRRRRRAAVRFSSLSLVRAALPRRPGWKRHVPFALFLLALASLALAAARPVAIASVPADQTTILLSIDVSRSMCSTDIPPNRLEAAEAAAVAFIDKQKPGALIGIVAFSSYAELVHPPSADRDSLRTAIRSLTTGRRTAIGSGILRSVDAIAEIDENVAPVAAAGEPAVVPVPTGAYAPSIIVLLTDGVSNAGPHPLEAAQQAADRGVRVYTIGFGTERGAFNPYCDPRFQGREPSRGGGMMFPGGGNFRRGIDEETLQQVAEMTGASYYAASSAGELDRVFQELPTHLIMKHETTEISFAFSAVGALLAALAVLLSMIWRPLP